MYNIELFNMFTHSFVSVFTVESFPIGVDYISPRTFDVEGPADLVVELKNTVRIKDIEYGNATIFVGFVRGFDKDINRTVLTLAPMMMLLNEVSMQNIFDETGNQNWRYQIYNQIYNDFMRATPSLFSIPWVYTTGYPTTRWGATKKVGYSAELKNDMECVISARKARGKYMRFAIGTSSSSLGKPYFGFLSFNETLTFEADLENVVTRKISETDKEGFNNALLWYPRDLLGNYNAYGAGLKPDGTITYSYAERIAIPNIRLTEKVLDHEPDRAERQKLFASMLQPGSSNFEIELTYKRDDKLIPSWTTGAPATIITSQKTYNTYVTGFERNGDLLTLKFGTVRQDLTSILNREDS